MRNPAKRHFVMILLSSSFSSFPSSSFITVALAMASVVSSNVSPNNYCPKECLCLSQIQVLCNTGNLTVIPMDFPNGTQEIVITNQNIKEIPQKAFSHLKHLRRLVLDSNNISIISPFAFKDLHDMAEISIQNNPLTRLTGFAFAGLRNITHLCLGYNRITKIDGYAFAGTEYIQMLLLNNNPIKSVNSSAFSGLKHVEFLFLPAGVQTLASDAFNGLEYVGLLKLAYLDLIELAPFTFRGLNAVRQLTIENSDLATVRAGAFMGIGSLGELRIAKNKIDRIEDFSLPNAVGKLVLKGNHILDIPSPRALANLDAERVTVADNHFPCTCRVLFLLESPLSQSRSGRPNQIGRGNDIEDPAATFMRSNKCISPFILNGRSMADMKTMGMLAQCKKSREKIIKEDYEQEEKNEEQGRMRLKLLNQREKERKRLRSDASLNASLNVPNGIVEEGNLLSSAICIKTKYLIHLPFVVTCFMWKGVGF